MRSKEYLGLKRGLARIDAPLSFDRRRLGQRGDMEGKGEWVEGKVTAYRHCRWRLFGLRRGAVTYDHIMTHASHASTKKESEGGGRGGGRVGGGEGERTSPVGGHRGEERWPSRWSCVQGQSTLSAARSSCSSFAIIDRSTNQSQEA